MNTLRYTKTLNDGLPVAIDTMLKWLLSDEPGRSVEGIDKHARINAPRVEQLQNGMAPDQREYDAVQAMFVDQWSLTRRLSRPTRAELIVMWTALLVSEPDQDARETIAGHVRSLADGSARGSLDGSLVA